MKRIIQVTMLVLIPFLFYAQIENWVYRFNGQGNLYDDASTIVYGADGNIYAAGATAGVGLDGDLMVVSLTSTGDTNWTYIYDGPGNDYDFASSIVYGPDNNIYVAGYSTGSGTGMDLIVISLTASGDTNWTYRYNGTANSDDLANSLVYGGGNVYVAGYSFGSGTSTDFMVISIANTGSENWVFRYNGPGNASDVAYSVMYGADGYIYAAGYSFSSGTFWDFTVLSLTTTGDSNWVYTYNGPGNFDDMAFSLANDAFGNIYAAGYSLSSGAGSDFTVISITFTGVLNWMYTYNGSGNDLDEARSIIYGGDGNIYAAGFCTGSGTGWDVAIVSLTTQGDTNWTYTYNGPGDADDFARSIVYGADGNVYAAGYSTSSSVYYDFLVMSLDSSGTENWVYRYDGPANDNDEAYSVVYGADNNLYCAGMSVGNGTSDDFTVISLGTTGVEEENTRDIQVCNNNVICVLPNPCSYAIKIHCNLSRTDLPGSLCLYDCAGRLQEVIWQGISIPPGSFYYHPSRDLSSGIYHIVLETETGTYTKRLTVVR